ncbi:TVP38/TMEM64 family protein [uncultured Oscillibacter sp.]|uniref:TVP38/TMEM64 family protein n=1 Tax=uncultured Oscillibacter sp. TaxID=876091 RepID=UPI0025F77B29|nr:TVP38/TMEM64 family protein [uncultured Oscillibacter sp.]
MTQPIEKTALRAASLAGLVICVVLAVWGWRTGVLTSQERLEALVSGAGAAGALLFTVFQAVQVVIPILPGGLGCLAGVLLFGPVWGFVYNYVGICAGSLMAFAVARSCGKPLLPLLFSQKTIDRYSRWAEEKGRFSRLFALAIFLPVAPDDFLCYLAGTTEMSWRRYSAIIFLGKPFAIALYSLGLTMVWQTLVG